ALRIKASDKLTVICRKSNRYRCFIAIPPRITHAYRVMHDHASTVISTCMWVKRIIISSFTCNCFLRYIQLPDPRKAVDHMLPLPLQLRFIIEMLQLTSAALRIDWASWLNALLALRMMGQQLPVAILFFALQHLSLDTLTWQRMWDEQGEALLCTSDTITIMR